jgi:hypothetical protein
MTELANIAKDYWQYLIALLVIMAVAGKFYFSATKKCCEADDDLPAIGS